MRKFIHSDFEIDLSKLKISTQEENHWFSDSFFAKFSLPFEIDLDSELDETFGFISFYNSQIIETQFEGHYFENGEYYTAIFEIEEAENRLQCSVRFGLEEFPNFDKSLTELNLDKFEVENIYDHAAEVITKTWPEVNYNFPQIHTDKIDTDSDIWFAFEKIINNYKDGQFLRNELDLVENISYNRNIMQPMPYLLHVFITAFADAGYELQGDILSDEFLKKIILYSSVDYQTTFEQQSINIFQMSEDNAGEFVEPAVQIAFGQIRPAYTYTYYYSRKVIEFPGMYRIIGKIRLARFLLTSIPRTIKIKYRTQILFEFSGAITGPLATQPIITFNIDVTFETISDLDENFITIESKQGPSVEKIIFELDINPIRLHDSSGEAIPTVINPNKVDLTRTVPDMKFGDLFTAYRNWFNYGIEVVGNVVQVNFIQDQINSQDEFDLSHLEVKRPRRKFNKGISFLLQFGEVSSKDYKFLPVFQNASGVTNVGYIKDEKTNEIIVNAIPLPLLERNGVQSAHGFEDDRTKIYAVLYSGLTRGLNITSDPDPISMPSAHARHSKDWFSRRIHSQVFQWSFTDYYEKLIGLKLKRSVFAYGLSHIIKTINRDEIGENLYQIDIETESSLK